MQSYSAIGIMSGTSLDGLDIAYCEFQVEKEQWKYDINLATTISYPEDLATELRQATSLSGLALKHLDVRLGGFVGEYVGNFIRQNDLQPTLIASHGHTIFHQPELRFTHQIGDPNVIHAKTGMPVVADFRSLDLALGGDGAPLVPIGDQLLFSKYDACLNLGGIANISYDDPSGNRKAFDIVPVNMGFNHLANRAGHAYDQGGAIARTGKKIDELITTLSELTFHKQTPPKSLGYEWFESNILPELTGHSIEDLMHSYATYASDQINKSVEDYVKGDQLEILVTGGGAYNDHLISLLRQKSKRVNWVIPEVKVIEYKEALIFALLGVLRIRNEVNILSSATGASEDSVAGVLLGHPSNIG